MSPNAQLLRERRAHNRQVGARALCKQRQGSLKPITAALEPELWARGYTAPTSLERGATIRKRPSVVEATSERSYSHANSDTAPLHRALVGLAQRIGRRRAVTFSEAAEQQKIVVPPTLSARLPRHGKHCCPCRRPRLGRHPAWPRAPGLWWCKRRGRRGAAPRGRRRWPASKPVSKQRAPRRPIPARRTSRLATASAHPDGAFRRHGCEQSGDRGEGRNGGGNRLEPHDYRNDPASSRNNPLSPASEHSGSPRIVDRSRLGWQTL